ncbi:DUF3299 domain-containing protein [Parvularcula marina]|uniref:DUF3299 domain-containing protein n=2 Tax=Parvularcula marina TaxID=2292771 RepID=A0A371R8I3_9PROT|nr:DUF3299 domain-containing protein [Parvularcula marina]
MIMTFLIAALSLLQPAEPQEISWNDLVPEGVEEVEAPELDHEKIGQQTGSAETVAELDGAYIKMPGFMLPLDYTERGRVRAFLLVPYYGACIHVPPPPPNQIVFVDTAEKPVESKGLWDPVWVTGTMRVKPNENDLGDTAYTLELEKLEPYID